MCLHLYVKVWPIYNPLFSDRCLFLINFAEMRFQCHIRKIVFTLSVVALYVAFFVAQILSVNLDSPGKSYTLCIYGGLQYQYKAKSIVIGEQDKCIQSETQTGLRINKRFHPGSHEFCIPVISFEKLSFPFSASHYPVFNQSKVITPALENYSLRGPPVILFS